MVRHNFILKPVYATGQAAETSFQKPLWTSQSTLGFNLTYSIVRRREKVKMFL